MSFTPRLTAPSLDNEYYYSNFNPYYRNGMGMPNCTAYAWGRAAEILETAPDLYYGNAENWYPNTTAYRKGQMAELGAIACWGDGGSGHGHNAVVEEIVSNGVILVSESAYQQWVFRTHTYTYPYSFTGYDFQGFIYIYETPPQPTPWGTPRFNHFKFVLYNRRKRNYGQ